MPVWTVGAAQPLRRVVSAPGCDLPEEVRQIPIPPNAHPGPGSDAALIVYQPATGTDWEIWRANPAPDGSWSACWGGKIDLARSSGVFPAPYGLSASGISYLATMITERDIASGAIHHAIAMQVTQCGGSTPPADRGDCRATGVRISEGTWLRMPGSVSMPAGLTPFGQMVFRALQHYGAVVTDQAGAVMIQAESPGDWAASGHYGIDPITASWQGEPEYRVVATLPWSELQVVHIPRSWG